MASICLIRNQFLNDYGYVDPLIQNNIGDQIPLSTKKKSKIRTLEIF